MMWPSARLESGRRYIVAIRNIAYDTNGSLIPASPALRDGMPSSDPNINGRRALFKDIFSHLSDAGVEQGDLQLAWDFTVGTTKSLTERMVGARDDAMARLEKSECAARVLPGPRSARSCVVWRRQTGSSTRCTTRW